MNERRTAAGFPLVAIAAGLWGTDALFRRGLALELPATTVVMYEHLILTLIFIPVLIKFPWRKLSVADTVSLLIIGVGASALATVMFTMAFRYGDPNTPLLLQKLQPFIAVLGAWWLLGERLKPRFGLYLGVAVVAGWFITFPNPLDVRLGQAIPALLAAGAAALWGLGTVLGRRMTASLTFVQLSAARFGIGLPAALLFLLLAPTTGGTVGQRLAIGGDDVIPLLLLALIPGMLSLMLYYRGLRATPASAATIAELAFPVVALTVNYFAFGARLTLTQAIGVAVLSVTLVIMSYVGRDKTERLGIEVPHEAPGSTRSAAS